MFWLFFDSLKVPSVGRANSLYQNLPPSICRFLRANEFLLGSLGLDWCVISNSSLQIKNNPNVWLDLVRYNAAISILMRGRRGERKPGALVDDNLDIYIHYIYIRDSWIICKPGNAARGNFYRLCSMYWPYYVLIHSIFLSPMALSFLSYLNPMTT